jgi:hypothetical protein
MPGGQALSNMAERTVFWHALDRDIHALAEKMPPTATIGLELRLAYALSVGQLSRTAWPDFEHAPLRKIFYRPALEPILLSYWPKLQNWPLTPQTIVDLAQILTQKSVGFATGQMITRAFDSDNACIGYEPPPLRANWLADIHKACNFITHPLDCAAYAYARTLFAHPLQDGNGRLARAFFYAVLAHRGVLLAPVLALTPLCMLYCVEQARTMAALTQTQDWNTYFSDLRTQLMTGCALLKELV